MIRKFTEWIEHGVQALRRIYFSQTLLWILVAIGIFLHLAEYVYNRSLWVDEAGVAITVLERPYKELLPSSVEQDADYAQTAPTGFLLVVKTLAHIFGDSEYVLKLFPLASGIIALLLFMELAPQCVRPASVPISVCLLATSNALITLATSLKQYSTDAFITLLLSLFCLSVLSGDVALFRMVVLGITGAMAIWFSHPSIFILASGGSLLLLIWFQQKQWRALKLFLFPAFCWLGSFGIKYFLFRQVTDNTDVRRFWATEFMPLPPSSWEETMWFVKTFFETLRYALQFPRPFLELVRRLKAVWASIVGTSPSIGASLKTLTTWIAADLFWLSVYLVIASLLLIGCAVMFSKNKQAFFLLSLPILLTLIASGFYAYPFGNRLILFLIPFLFLFMGEGAAYTFKRHHLLGVVCIGMLVFYPISSAWHYLFHPRIHEHARPVVAYLKEHRQPDDIVYVYYGGQQVFAYYARRLDVNRDNIVQGIASRDEWQKYLDDLDRLRGNSRVWLFFSHAYSEEAFFLSYLDHIGKQLDTYKDVRASIYLYDLK